MSKQFRQLIERNPGLMSSISLLLVAAVSGVVIFAANMIAPANVVLGTMSLTPAWAVVLSASALSFLTVLAMPLVNEFELRQKRDLKPAEIMGVYLVINFIALWLISRVADVLGLGLSSWMVVLVLAAVLDLAQGIVMMQVEKLRTE